MLTMSGFLKKELLHKGQLDVKYMDIPEEYQVLNWIKKNKSNGYLDIKYIPIDKSIIKTTVIIDEWFSSNTNRIMGVDAFVGESTAISVGIRATNTSSTPRGFYAYHSGFRTDTKKKVSLGVPYELVHEMSGLSVNGEKFESEGSFKSVPAFSYYLFCINMPSGAESTANQKEIAGGFKRTQIFEGSTLIKDMIPVYNKTTKYYGMYDVVNKEFLPASNKTAFFGA